MRIQTTTMFVDETPMKHMSFFFQPGGHVPLRRGVWLRRHHVSLTACPWDFHHGTDGKTIWGHIGLGKKRFRIGNLTSKVMVMGNGI